MRNSGAHAFASGQPTATDDGGAALALADVAGPVKVIDNDTIEVAGQRLPRGDVAKLAGTAQARYSDKTMSRLALILMCWLVLAGPALADYDEGWAAWLAGDYETALREFQPLAERGDARAQLNLGLMYANGHGVPQDSAEAVKWYNRAAEQGIATAQSNLGLMYALGLGVLQNLVLAYMWFDLATMQGEKTASEGRDLVAARMTPADVSKAQRMAREWLAIHGKAD